MFVPFLLSFALTTLAASHLYAMPTVSVPPPEPNEEHLVNEDVNIITGLYYREYSLQNNGIIDYKTARQIIISEYNEHWNTVIETKEYPLFYWFDANHDGEMDMWVDQQVEGCFCDIVPYNTTYQE